MPQKRQYIRTSSRSDILKLASYLARAIDTRFLHARDKTPLISVLGPMGCGKSLIVESMMKTWMDQYRLKDAAAIAFDNKMFLETEPCGAALRTAYTDAHVAGKSARLAFNSDHIVFQEELNVAISRGFENARYGGVMFLSNDQRLPNDKEDMMPWIEIDIGNFLPSGGGDVRLVQISVHNDALKNDTRFKVYWQRINEYCNRAGLKNLSDESAAISLAMIPA